MTITLFLLQILIIHFMNERFLLLGRSERSNILVVVHCERDNNLRIISARKATKQETIQYGRQQ